MTKNMVNNKWSMVNKLAGFTIVELMIYMGLFLILLTVLTGVFTQTIDLQLESKSRSVVEEDSRFILSRLTYDIRRATSITTPASPGNTTQDLQMVINAINYSYALNSGNLEISNNNGTDQLNSSETSISNLSFTRLGNIGGKNTLQVNFTITGLIEQTSGPDTKTVTSTIGLR